MEDKVQVEEVVDESMTVEELDRLIETLYQRRPVPWDRIAQLEELAHDRDCRLIYPEEKAQAIEGKKQDTPCDEEDKSKPSIAGNG